MQDEYSVNNPDANNAATKIQAQFRGHKARKDLEKIKQDVRNNKFNVLLNNKLIFCSIHN